MSEDTMNGFQRSAPLALLLLAVGCGGSAGTVPVTPAALPPTTAALLRATFTMHWGGTQSQAALRSPKYIAATTRSIAIFVNNGPAQITNAPPVGQPQTTNIVIDAPAGTDTFTIASYDATNGVGNVLSHAVFSQQIVAGVANALSASLNGVVSKASVSLANATPPAGTAATSAVNVTAFDPDGNVIVGPTDYDRPVLLTNSDASGVTSLSTTTVANASTAVTLSYNGKALTSATVNPGRGTGATFAPTPTITEYAVPSAQFGELTSIAAGSDGNVWFTEYSSNAIGRITPGGVVSTFPIPSAGSSPGSIVGAADGALWFTQSGTNQVGRMTTQGGVTEFPFPAGQGTQGAIVASPQGVMFLERPDPFTTFMGYVLYSGGYGELPLGASNYIAGATLGPDGNVWYIDGQLRRYVYNGPIGAFALPPECASPDAIAAGPDGALWYVCDSSNYVVRQTTAGVATAFHVPGLLTGLKGIAVGPDGALWFTELLDKIGRITTSGTITEYPVPTSGGQPFAITAGPDGNIWFTEYSSHKIGKLVY